MGRKLRTFVLSGGRHLCEVSFRFFSSNFYSPLWQRHGFYSFETPTGVIELLVDHVLSTLVVGFRILKKKVDTWVVPSGPLSYRNNYGTTRGDSGRRTDTHTHEGKPVHLVDRRDRSSGSVRWVVAGKESRDCLWRARRWHTVHAEIHDPGIVTRSFGLKDEDLLNVRRPLFQSFSYLFSLLSSLYTSLLLFCTSSLPLPDSLRKSYRPLSPETSHRTYYSLRRLLTGLATLFR